MEMSETFGFSNFCNSEIHKVKSSADKGDFKGLTCKQKEFRDREGTLYATDIITGCKIDGSKN